MLFVPATEIFNFAIFGGRCWFFRYPSQKAEATYDQVWQGALREVYDSATAFGPPSTANCPSSISTFLFLPSWVVAMRSTHLH
jgi:hypothetical protein